MRRHAIDGSHWLDKYNISPYYATGHAIVSLEGIDEVLGGKAADWIISTQKENGAWGFNGGTPEETGYALQGLLHYHTKVEKIDEEVLINGFRYLSRTYGIVKNSPIWMSKALYCPENIAQSATISAMYWFAKVKCVDECRTPCSLYDGIREEVTI